MVGLIWFVQIVHYPLFDHVSPNLSPSYEIAHIWRTIELVGPMMALEGITGFFLLWYRPGGVSLPLVWSGLGLLCVIWLSSFVLQVPLHDLLSEGFDAAAHRHLVLTNWIRTVAWSLRGFLVCKMLWKITL